MTTISFHFLSQPTTLHNHHHHHLNNIFSTQLFNKHHHITLPSITKCTPNSDIFPTPSPDSNTTTPTNNFPIDKIRRSEILRDPKTQPGLTKPEPPNFEVGWKRTKKTMVEKPVGYVIMDFLEKLEELMGKEFGSKELLAKAGEIVAERVREEAQVLVEEGKVEGRMVIELDRVLKLLEMDLVMVKAAVKDETLGERLEQAKARCRQAILVANSF